MTIGISVGISPEHLAIVYSDPYVARVAHDDRPHYPVFSDIAQYVTAWVGSMFAGAFLVIKWGSHDWDVHALLLKKHVKHSRALGELFISWCFSHADVMRLTAKVIEGLESARNYTTRLGFVQEGFRRDAYIVNGELKGEYVMGLTLSDWVKR